MVNNLPLFYISYPPLISEIDVSSKTKRNFYIYLSWVMVGGGWWILIMDDRKITGNPINLAVYYKPQNKNLKYAGRGVSCKVMKPEIISLSYLYLLS